MVIGEDYYKNEYLLGRAPVIPDGQFAYWEREAIVEIDHRRVLSDVDDAPDYLANCVCEVAEFLYSRFKAMNATDGEQQGPVSSFSNDGYSVHYVDVNKALREMTALDFSSTIKSTVAKWLFGTEYHNTIVFRGV